MGLDRLSATWEGSSELGGIFRGTFRIFPLDLPVPYHARWVKYPDAGIAVAAPSSGEVSIIRNSWSTTSAIGM